MCQPNAKSQTAQTKQAEQLSQFLFNSPTPFHAVEQVAEKLQEAGFQELHEADTWIHLQNAQVADGFFCRRGGSLIAWLCAATAPWEKSGGFHLAAAHTDSPCLKLKLESAHFEFGTLLCHVSVYGSPIFATHTDRSMAVAGIAVESDGSTNKFRLLQTAKAVALLPNLAIHLNREANQKLSYNAQSQLKAVFGLGTATDKDKNKDKGKLQAIRKLRQSLGLRDDETCELQLCSAQTPQLLGLEDELLSGARLDDLTMVYLLLEQMIQLKRSTIQASTWPVAIFCNGEEVGSRTYEGAASNFSSTVLQRIVRNAPALKASGAPKQKTKDLAEAWARVQARSFLLSLDGAHASHPSYPEAFDPNFALQMGAGPAIKLPNGASYSSEVFSIAQVQAIAASTNAAGHSCQLQNAVPRSDKATGSTVGPILTSQLGIRGVDIGLPMYAMHSLQETIAMPDYISLQNLVAAYYQVS